PLARVRVIESRPVAARSSKDKVRLASRFRMLEGPYQNKELWAASSALIPTGELPADIAAKMAALPYEQRMKLIAPQSSPATKEQSPGAEKTLSERQSLVAKRRAKKNAANRAMWAREATAAKAQAIAEKEAKAEYERMLPYLLENQRQMLQRQSEAE